MKIASFLLLAAALLFSSGPVPENQPTEQIEISAVKLSPQVAKQYKDGPRLAAFTIDRAGIVRPRPGYRMVFVPGDGRIWIGPEKDPVITEDLRALGYDDVEIPGGIAVCSCGDLGDDCSFAVTIQGGTVRHECRGECGCDVIVHLDPDKCVEYQTNDGGWSSF